MTLIYSTTVLYDTRLLKVNHPQKLQSRLRKEIVLFMKMLMG